MRIKTLSQFGSNACLLEDHETGNTLCVAAAIQPSCCQAANLTNWLLVPRRMRRNTSGALGLGLVGDIAWGLEYVACSSVGNCYR